MNARGDRLESGHAGRAVAPRERAPGTEGIWTFVFIDMLVFLLIFFVYMTERLFSYDLYKASQSRLVVWFGFANSLILLTSSWMVVEAIRAARARQPGRVRLHLLAAFTLGALFAADKLVEYHLKFAGGISLVENPFFTFYFFITFVHFLHVLAGMLFLCAYLRSSGNCMRGERYVVGLENLGLFWHYVDVLWIFIFPMLYLI